MTDIGGMQLSKVMCIIPARGGSKGLVGKNIKLLRDKPLIAWTIEAAQKSKYIDRVIVSTDDSQIKAISMNYGADIIDRPAELATDEASTMDVVLHSLAIVKKEENYYPDYIILLQCTSPLRTEKHIDEAIEKLLDSGTEADSLISVTKEEHPIWWLRKINANGYLERFFDFDSKRLVRRQDFEELYRPNGAIYITKADVIVTQKSFQTEKTAAYTMDAISSIDIDTKDDFELAEYYIRKHM